MGGASPINFSAPGAFGQSQATSSLSPDKAPTGGIQSAQALNPKLLTAGYVSDTDAAPKTPVSAKPTRPHNLMDRDWGSGTMKLLFGSDMNPDLYTR